MPLRRLLLSLFALLAATAPLLPQETATDPQAEDLGFGDEVSVQWVLVPVVVRSPDGFVDSLTQEDFELLVDGRSAAIESFHYDDRAPVRLIFLQDLSGSMATEGKLARSREAVRYFLRHARPGDRYAIGTFANRGLMVDVPLTDDRGALREAIGLWEAYGMTALHDAIGWIPRITGGDGALRPAVVLITDGVDNASLLEAGEARAIVRRAEIPVYTLGLSSGDPYLLDASGETLHRNADTLNMLSLQTGGRYFPLTIEDDILAACAQILAEIRHQYVLGFRTGAGEAGHHEITVRVKRGRDREVTYRRGYTGTLPAP